MKQQKAKSNMRRSLVFPGGASKVSNLPGGWPPRTAVSYGRCSPKPKLVERVRSLFNHDDLKAFCQTSVKDIFKYAQAYKGSGKLETAEDRPNARYVYRRQASRKHAILGVAHCDVVAGLGNHFSSAFITRDTLIFSPRLDDRLGVYTLLNVLPKLGINTDLLLTTGEETGNSSAKEFTTEETYNWMYSFDRKDDDAVVYCYDGMRSAASKFFQMGFGSYSDIVSLSQLKCQGINVGVGYTKEHSDHCHMSLNTWAHQVARFVLFYFANLNTHMPYDASAVRTYCDFPYSPYRLDMYLPPAKTNASGILPAPPIIVVPGDDNEPVLEDISPVYVGWECPFCNARFTEEAVPGDKICPECSSWLVKR